MTHSTLAYTQGQIHAYEDLKGYVQRAICPDATASEVQHANAVLENVVRLCDALIEDKQKVMADLGREAIAFTAFRTIQIDPRRI